MSNIDKLMEMWGCSRPEAEKKIARLRQARAEGWIPPKSTEKARPKPKQQNETPAENLPEPILPKKPPALKPSREAKKPPIISTEDLLEQLRKSPQDRTLLGTLLCRGAVTLLVAITSAGKTILVHRLGHCLASGLSFFGMNPEGPLQVLHIDMESPPAVREDILEVMPPVPGWDTTPIGIEQKEAKELVRSQGYDLIIVDNLQTVYPVKNEQDNAEAIRQMRYFTDAAKDTDTAVLVVFNTGKVDSNNPRGVDDVHLARGASARVDQADLSINLIEKNGTCTMKVVKSRFGNKGETIKYKWAGEYDYELISHTRVVSGAQKELEQAVLEILPLEPDESKRAWIVGKLGIENGTSRDRLLTRGLKALVVGGKVRLTRHGHYQRIRRPDDG